MPTPCCCDDTLFVDTPPQFIERSPLHHNLTVVQSEEHGEEIVLTSLSCDDQQQLNQAAQFVPTRVYNVWHTFVRVQYPRDTPSGTDNRLQCLQMGVVMVGTMLLVPLFLAGPLLCWSWKYFEVRRLDHFRRHHLPPGYRVEITRSDHRVCSIRCLPTYELRMYVSREVYDVAAAADFLYRIAAGDHAFEEYSQEYRRDQERVRRDRLLARPEARQQVSNLQESSVEEVLTTCQLDEYASRFREEGVTSVKLLLELTYEDLGFMRAGHRRRLFLYLHPQESVTETSVKRALSS